MFHRSINGTSGIEVGLGICVGGGIGVSVGAGVRVGIGVLVGTVAIVAWTPDWSCKVSALVVA